MIYNKAKEQHERGFIMIKSNSQTALNTRNPYFDNLKFGLILLVVIGHLSDLLKDSSCIMSVIRSVIYFFHMPLFIFVSGYFSNYGEFGIKKNFLKVFNLFCWYILFKFGLFFTW
ncbi:acyltransferase family protein [Anaerostipes hominis (ex Lee et al. 2021)]|uniref:acyltransferase family protein n=2 Tax=Lachnospiraceae TaxID=186803 RepID=UPI0004649925